MNCPKCQNTMREREKGDVIIDVCAGCRGIWLDAGEMEKLVEGEERYYEREDNRRQRDFDDDFSRDHVGGRYRREGYGTRPQQKKRGGFLSNMFESFGGGDD